MDELRKHAVIVAGGSGSRMGNALPKQFLPLCGRPVLSYSINAFIEVFPDINIILVLPEQMLSYANIVLQTLKKPIDATIVSGGPTRFHSVKNGLRAINEPGIVFIHDGARPLIDAALLTRCLEGAIAAGSAIPAIAVAESMRMATAEGTIPVDRDQLRIIQTPQTFKTEIILPAFGQEHSTAFTDEATVLEAWGGKVSLVVGDKRNIKITTPEDMLVAEALLKAKASIEQ